jgi:hypothetical protein
MPWLLVVSGQEQVSSYASGMKEAAQIIMEFQHKVMHISHIS